MKRVYDVKYRLVAGAAAVLSVVILETAFAESRKACPPDVPRSATPIPPVSQFYKQSQSANPFEKKGRFQQRDRFGDIGSPSQPVPDFRPSNRTGEPLGSSDIMDGTY